MPTNQKMTSSMNKKSTCLCLIGDVGTMPKEDIGEEQS
jgi:hypothetical protein